jgi:hypothetical protein
VKYQAFSFFDSFVVNTLSSLSPAGFHAQAANILADSRRFDQSLDLVVAADVIEVSGTFFDGHRGAGRNTGAALQTSPG